MTLARLPLCLLVRADQLYQHGADLLKEGAAGKVPLSLPPHELLPRLFQKEMVRRNIVWRTAMETSSQDLHQSTCATDSAPDSLCRHPSCSAIPHCACYR